MAEFLGGGDDIMRYAVAIFAFCAAVIISVRPGAADQITVNGNARTYVIKQPSTVTGPRPTVIVLHGAKGAGASVAQSTKLDSLAPQQGFVAVFPDGQRQQWNFFLPGKEADFFVKASGGRDKVPDDGAFLKSLIGDLVARRIADPRRIYLFGEAGGGLLALRMICTDADLFAGIALSGSAMPEALSDCHPSRPIPALLIKGTKDDLLPYAGGLNEPSETYRIWPTDRLIDFFRQLDADTGPAQSSVLPRKVPNIVQIERWTSCPGVPLAVYRVIDGSHVAPPDLNEGQIALDFFAAPAPQTPCVASLQNPASGADTSGTGPDGQGTSANATPGDATSNPNSPANNTGPGGTDPNTPNGPDGTGPGNTPGDNNTAGLGPPSDNNPGNTAGLGPPPDDTPATSTAGLGPPPEDTPATSTAGLGPPPDDTPATSTTGLGPPPNNSPPSNTPGTIAMVPPPIFTPLPPIVLPVPTSNPRPPVCPPCRPGCMGPQPHPPTGNPPTATNTGGSSKTATAVLPPVTLPSPASPPKSGGTIYGGTCKTVGSLTTCTGDDGRTCTTKSGFCNPGTSQVKPPPLPTTTASTTPTAPSPPPTTAGTHEPAPATKKKAAQKKPPVRYYNPNVDAANAAAAAATVMGIVGAFGRHGGGGGGWRGGGGNPCHHH